MAIPSGTVRPMADQYSLRKIMIIWALSALPMGLLAAVVAPWVASVTHWPLLLVYWGAVLAGLLWQCVLSLIILKRDGHALNWQTVKTRMRYQKPVHPRSGRSSYWLLLWTIPFIAVSALLQSGLIHLPNVDALMNPLLRYFPVYDLSSLATAEYKGAWWILIMFIITSLFNYFLGEEFIYRGILLPKMKGVFGKYDWFFNGVLFGLYHLHKPQVIVSTALYFGFVFAFPSRLFQSSWMAVIIHGLEGVLGIVVILGIVLGVSN